MANGRLAKCTINPYGSALVYENTSGSSASISLSAQVLDRDGNSDISVAIEDTTRTVCGTTIVDTICAPMHCIASIVTCSSGSYQGVYVGNAGCFHPMYIDCNNCVYCTPYRYNSFGCCWNTCITLQYVCCSCPNTLICCYTCCCPIPVVLDNTEILPNRNAYENPRYLEEERSRSNISQVSFDCTGLPRYYCKSDLITETSKASNFVNPTALFLMYPCQCYCTCCCTLCCYINCSCNTYISAAVDYWSDTMGIIGIAENNDTCSIATYRLCACYWCCTCAFSSYYSHAYDGCRYVNPVRITYLCEIPKCGLYYCTCTVQIRSYSCIGCFVSCCSVLRHFCLFGCGFSEVSGSVTSPTTLLTGMICSYRQRTKKIHDLFTSNKGPSFLSGCNLLATKPITCDYYYVFRGHNYCNNFCGELMRDLIHCATCASLTLYTFDPGVADINNSTNDQIYPIKWLSYNPITKCNYFMNFGTIRDNRGIYSVNWDKVCCTSLTNCTCEGYCNSVCFGSEGFNTFFSKVADLPSPLVNCDPTTFCPTPIFRTGKSAWRFSVNDGGTWKEYCSSDMVNWNQRTSYSNIEFYPNVSYTTTGTTIVANCDCYFNVINSSTYTDYKVSINNYERTGLVVSNGDKIYMNNPSGYQVSVNVWGYEG